MTNYLFLKKTEQQQQPEYRFSLQNGILTKEQRDFYEKNGFLVISNLVSLETLDRFR